MRENWRNYMALRRFSNPLTTPFYLSDSDRTMKYRKLRAMGFAHTSARKYTSQNFGHKGDQYIAEGHRKGLAHAISLPRDIEGWSVDDKVRVALALLGESRLRALGESKPSLEAELIGEARQIEESGGDVNKFIEDRANSLRLQARAVRSSISIDAPVEDRSHRVGSSPMSLQLPAHEEAPSSLDEEQRYLGSLEDFADNYMNDAGIESNEIRSIIMGKALAPAKSLMVQGVKLDKGNILALAQDIKELVLREADKLKERVEERADNPEAKYRMRGYDSSNVKVGDKFQDEYTQVWTVYKVDLHHGQGDNQMVFLGLHGVGNNMVSMWRLNDAYRKVISSRSDNPAKMYYLSSTRKDSFPYKKIEGRADMTQLMMIASKAAKSIGSPKPKNVAGAIRVLDRAGFRVGEVR